MKKWKGMDLDDSAMYQFTELSGSTSINLRIQTVAADPVSRAEALSLATALLFKSRPMLRRTTRRKLRA